MTAALRIVVLAAIWVGLWGQVSIANVVFGLTVAALVTLAFPSLDGANGNRIRPVAAIILLARFTVMLVQSTWSVVIAVVRPTAALDEAIIAVALRTTDPVVVTMVANGISLTPGTLTVDVGPDRWPDRTVLYVHTLTLGDRAVHVAAIHRLEDLVTAAFPPPHATQPDPDVPGSATR